jgi:hypothetical protein
MNASRNGAGAMIIFPQKKKVVPHFYEVEKWAYNGKANTEVWVLLVDHGDGLYQLCQKMS